MTEPDVPIYLEKILADKNPNQSQNNLDYRSQSPRIKASSFAHDIEPEYVAISHDSHTAWITLQENNDFPAGSFPLIPRFTLAF